MFQISAMPYSQFESLFTCDTAILGPKRAVRVIADATPGYPCRVSLDDAKIGEELILANFIHHDVDGPFRGSHAIYIRHNAQEWMGEPNTIPPALERRTISWRAFDHDGYMQNAGLAGGLDLPCAINAALSPVGIHHIDLHYAGAGCFAARAVRA